MQFLQSGRRDVSSRLALPETEFLLDGVRPDVVMLRVWAFGMVEWHSVQATAAWVLDRVCFFPSHSGAPSGWLSGNFVSLKYPLPPSCTPHTVPILQIPACIRKGAFVFLGEVGLPFKPKTLSVAELMAAAAKKKSTNKPQSADAGSSDPRPVSQDEEESEDEDEEQDEGPSPMARRLQAMAVAGACLAIGTRFAGSQSEDAFKIVSSILATLVSWRDGSSPLVGVLECLDLASLSPCSPVKIEGPDTLCVKCVLPTTGPPYFRVLCQCCFAWNGCCVCWIR